MKRMIISTLLVAAFASAAAIAANPPSDEKMREVDYRNLPMPSETMSARMIRSAYEAMKGNAKPAGGNIKFVQTEHQALSWGLFKDAYGKTGLAFSAFCEAYQGEFAAEQLTEMGRRLNRFGLAMALTDYFFLSDPTDNSGARELGLLKDMMNYVAGVAADRLNWSSLGRGMIVVAAVDMMLNKIGNDAVAWQYRNWQTAFDNYHGPGRGGRKAGPGYMPPKKWIELFDKQNFRSAEEACNYLRSHFMRFWDRWESDPSIVEGYTDQRKQVNNGIFDNLLNAMTHQGATAINFRTPAARKVIKTIVDQHIRDAYGPLLYYYATNTLPKKFRTEARKKAAEQMNAIIRASGVNEETVVRVTIRCNDDLGDRAIRIGPWTQIMRGDISDSMKFTRLSLSRYGGQDPLDKVSLLYRMKGGSQTHTITRPMQSLWKTRHQDVQFDLSGLIALRVRMINSITGDPVGGTVRATMGSFSRSARTSGQAPAYIGMVNLDSASGVRIRALATNHHPMAVNLSANQLRSRGNGLVVIKVAPVDPEPWLAIKRQREQQLRRRQQEEERRRRYEDEMARRRAEEERRRRQQEQNQNQQDRVSNARNREELRRNFQRQQSALYSEMERLMNAQARKVHDTIKSRTPPGYPDPCGGRCTGKYVTLDGMEEWRIKCARCGRGRGTTSSYTKMGKSADQIKAEYMRRIRSLEASYKAQMKRMGG